MLRRQERAQPAAVGPHVSAFTMSDSTLGGPVFLHVGWSCNPRSWSPVWRLQLEGQMVTRDFFFPRTSRSHQDETEEGHRSVWENLPLMILVNLSLSFFLKSDCEVWQIAVQSAARSSTLCRKWLSCKFSISLLFPELMLLNLKKWLT